MKQNITKIINKELSHKKNVDFWKWYMASHCTHGTPINAGCVECIQEKKSTKWEVNYV